MRIAHVKIHNFRSVKDVEFNCFDTVILLGENNAGKSNILSAIEFALTSSAKPEPEDLFAFRDEEDDQLWVELTFSDLTPQEQRTFQKYFRSDKTVCIRKTASWDEEGKVSIKYNGYLEEPKETWLQSSHATDYKTRRAAESTPLAPFLPEGRLTIAAIQEIQQQYIQAHQKELEFIEQLESNTLFGQRNVAAGLLPEFYLVPAIRDLDDEAKIKAHGSKVC